MCVCVCVCPYVCACVCTCVCVWGGGGGYTNVKELFVSYRKMYEFGPSIVMADRMRK